MRTFLLTVLVFLALFDVVSARGPEVPPLDFVTTPATGNFSSQIIGLEVYNNDNQDIARIEDISVGKDGHVEAFILSVSENLGPVAHFVAVKPSAVTFEPLKGAAPRQAHMDATADQLRTVPEYRYTGIRKACLNILRF